MKKKKTSNYNITICCDSLNYLKNSGSNRSAAQVNFISKSLEQAGYTPKVMPYTSNPDRYIAELKKGSPDILWNAFETFNGSKEITYLGALLLDESGVAYTGCRAQSVLFCADKTILKTILQQAKIPTPEQYSAYTDPDTFEESTWIIKPAKIHAHTLISEDHIVKARTEEELQNALIRLSGDHEMYAEKYIHGREFSVTLLDLGGGLKPLCVSEIKYKGYPVYRPRVYNPTLYNTHKALKDHCIEISYDHFFVDAPLVSKARALGNTVAKLLDLQGFATIDVRFDSKKNAYVTDVNTNPYLSEKSLFIQACGVMRVKPEMVIAVIANSA